MWEKILSIVGGKDTELRERMLRTIILFGGIATIVGTVESFFVLQMDIRIVICFSILIVIMIITQIIAFRYKKYDQAAMLLFVAIVAFLFPIMFMLSGGVYGASPVWFSLGVVYVFIMFRGKKQAVCLVVTVIINALTYLAAYWYPELIIPMETKAIVYMDSYFALIVVGLIVGMILKTHMKVFDYEHQQNIAQQKELEENRDTKNSFFANMSHEIRTPINAIIGLNEMIMRESDSEEVKNYAKDIRIAGDLLLAQVNDILDLSQMESTKLFLVPTSYDTAELFGSLVELMRARMEKKGLVFRTDIDPALPSRLFGDEKRVKQIMINLLDNAYKYTETGSVVLSAAGEMQPDGNIRMKVSVTDTGIGIRKEDMANIYDSYNRVDEKKNKKILGTGLGLAITKQLVDLMGGEITVDSIYTKGSIFTITFLQMVQDPSPVGTVDYSGRAFAGEEENYRPSFEAPKARVLIVDDNRMNTKVACSLLSATKVQIDTAASGEQCLEMTKEHHYHVVLLDYMMPDMDGVETLKRIRHQEGGLCRNSAVIALTANVMSGARTMYQEQGFDSFVGKPIVGKALELEILRLLPKDIVEYEEKTELSSEEQLSVQRVSVRKRKKLYITADCTCDIPEELLEKYDIRLAYTYIETPNGRFVDTKEIDTDSLNQYLEGDRCTATAKGMSVEEYESFFAEVLTEAEKVIHISMASFMGNSYHGASEAAKSFDHVHVIDSAQTSCGQSMLVLYAASMAMDGATADEVLAGVEKVKPYIRTRAIAPGAGIFYKNSQMKDFGRSLCLTFNLRPLLRVRSNHLKPEMLFGGTMENAWRNMIKIHLRDKKKISKKVVVITHVSCNVKEQQLIIREVLKQIPFEQVILQKASFTTACSTGEKSVGISYFRL